MPNYPNDPGPDKQQYCGYRPNCEESFITEDVLIGALELQTRYSYEAVRQGTEKAICHSDLQANNLFDIIEKLKREIDESFRRTGENIAGIMTDIKQLHNKQNELCDEVHHVDAELNARFSPVELQFLLNRIYGIA